jgi:hypothetical protein
MGCGLCVAPLEKDGSAKLASTVGGAVLSWAGGSYDRLAHHCGDDLEATTTRSRAVVGDEVRFAMADHGRDVLLRTLSEFWSF